MEGVLIKRLTAVNPKDERGMTYEWMKGLISRQITFSNRYTGTISGNHYHRGEDQSKNPERVVLLNGKMRMRICDGMNNDEIKIYEPFTEIIIKPRILHSFIADTDVLFAEYRPTIFNLNRSDTYSLEDFVTYMKKFDFKVRDEAIRRFLDLAVK